MSYGNYSCNRPNQPPPRNSNGEHVPGLSFDNGGTYTPSPMSAQLPPINNNGYDPLTPTFNPRVVHSATWGTIPGPPTIHSPIPGTPNMNKTYSPWQNGPPGFPSQHGVIKSYGNPKPSPEPLKAQMAYPAQHGFMQSYDIPQFSKEQFRAHMGFPTQPGYDQSYDVNQPLEKEAQPWKKKWRRENTPKLNSALLNVPAWLDPYVKKHQDVVKKTLSYDDLHFLAHHRPDPEAASVLTDLKDVAWGLQNAHRSYMECMETPCPALLKRAQVAESRFHQRKGIEKAMERDMLRMPVSIVRVMSIDNFVEETRGAVGGDESANEADHESGHSPEGNETWIPHF